MEYAVSLTVLFSLRWKGRWAEGRESLCADGVLGLWLCQSCPCP